MSGYGMELILYFLCFVVCIASSAYVKATMSKYKKVKCDSGMTGGDCARQILNNNGLYHVSINVLGQEGGDHYDPRSESVNLSSSVFYGTDVTALSVAAHECGHAVQHAEGYAPIQIRSAIVPAVNIGSKAAVPLFILGIICNYNTVLMQLGLIAFSLTVIFSFVTLPVEFDASRRALILLEEYGITQSYENKNCKTVLVAAALTYVASAAVAVMQMLRLILRYGSKSRR